MAWARENCRPDQLQTQTSGGNSDQSNQADNMEEKLVIRKKSLPTKGKKTLPKKGNFILYKNKDSDTWYRAQVIQRAVKASNPMPYFNVKAEFDNQAKGINLDEFDWVFDSPESSKGKEIYAGTSRKSPRAGASPRLKKREGHNVLFTTNYAAYEHCNQIERAENAEKLDKSYVVFIPKQDWDKLFVVEAKEKEINNFLKYGVYKEVSDLGQPRMSSGWVITEKCHSDVIGAKARLVVYGNQEGYTGSRDSPTVLKQSLRIQFTLAAQFQWELVMADITSAFLQSDVLDRELYVQPPKGTAKSGVNQRGQVQVLGMERGPPRGRHLGLPEGLHHHQDRVSGHRLEGQGRDREAEHGAGLPSESRHREAEVAS